MAIRAVIFDLGGTLLDYLGGAPTWEEAEQQAFRAVHNTLTAKGYALEWEKFRAAMGEVGNRRWNQALDGYGNPTIADLIAEACEQCDFRLDPADVEGLVRCYCEQIATLCRPFPESQPTLAHLKERGYQIGLISNTVLPGWMHQSDLERHGLLHYFDDLVFSADAGLWKPQPAVFMRAVASLGVAPSEAVFVGDKLYDDVGGSQRAGLKGILRLLNGKATDHALPVSREVRPDAVVEQLDELFVVLERLDSAR